MEKHSKLTAEEAAKALMAALPNVIIVGTQPVTKGASLVSESLLMGMKGTPIELTKVVMAGLVRGGAAIEDGTINREVFSAAVIAALSYMLYKVTNDKEASETLNETLADIVSKFSALDTQTGADHVDIILNNTHYEEKD